MSTMREKLIILNGLVLNLMIQREIKKAYRIPFPTLPCIYYFFEICQSAGIPKAGKLPIEKRCGDEELLTQIQIVENFSCLVQILSLL